MPRWYSSSAAISIRRMVYIVVKYPCSSSPSVAASATGGSIRCVSNGVTWNTVSRAAARPRVPAADRADANAGTWAAALRPARASECSIVVDATGAMRAMEKDGAKGGARQRGRMRQLQGCNGADPTPHAHATSDQVTTWERLRHEPFRVYSVMLEMGLDAAGWTSVAFLPLATRKQ
jgi:hypothetical protein